MRTYDTVETYLEVLSGLRDVVTGKPTSSYFLGFAPIISLARYDTDVLDSMSQATIANKALTTKQADLACKILLKYRRQLAAKSIDVSPVETPVWRLPLRVMDYQKLIDINDDTITVKFPYNDALVGALRAFAADSQGACAWDKDAKVWKAALTEYNLVWLQTWGLQNGFEIGASAAKLVALVESVESAGYAIELCVKDGALEITNCPDTLKEYIDVNLGGFSFDNLLRLVDSSAELGYTVEPSLADALVAEYGPRFISLARNKEVSLGDSTHFTDDDFKSVLDYAIQVGRTPVVIYEPGLRNQLLNKIRSWYPPEEIFEVRNGLVTELPTATFVHTIKPLRGVDRIPLLVSKAGMLYGGGQQLMIQRAGKVVYAVEDVYNPKKKVVKIAS